MTMITVYGTAWCEDTRRALRRLRRLGLSYRFLNVDEDFDALERALALSGGWRRTPIIDLGLGGPALVEPDNDELTGALVELEMLTTEATRERLGVQNVGDVERAARTLGGLAMIAAAARAPQTARWPVGLLGAAVALSGVAGWCPAYSCAGVTSLDGPGDRPDEARRTAWLTRQVPSATVAPAALPAGTGQ
jgi:hypothetical protein